MTEKTKDQQIQEKYVIYQILNQNLESLKNQQDVIESHIVEVRSTLNSLNDIENLEKDNEVFVPLGSGCYGRGSFEKLDEILVNVGAGIMMIKSLKEAKVFLNERMKELESLAQDIAVQMDSIAKEMNKIAVDIQSLASK